MNTLRGMSGNAFAELADADSGMAARGANTVDLRRRYNDEHVIPWQMGEIQGPMLSFQEWAAQFNRPIVTPVSQ